MLSEVIPILRLVFFLLGGLTLLLPHSAIADVTYYVTPGDESLPDLECPNRLEPCHNIDYYINNKTSFFSSDKMNVTMKLYEGTHTTIAGGAFEVFGLNRLTIITLSQM